MDFLARILRHLRAVEGVVRSLREQALTLPSLARRNMMLARNTNRCSVVVLRIQPVRVVRSLLLNMIVVGFMPHDIVGMNYCK